MPSIALSVIIVAYKSRDEIEACLQSIPRALAKGEVEVVVIDNFGQDGVGDWIRANAPWADYVRPAANLGFGRANNLGFACSRGECVLFLNPDTICNRDALEHCLRRVVDDSAIGVISPRLIMPDGTMDLACRRSIPTLWDGFCRAAGLASRFPQRAWFSGYNLTHLPAAGTYDVGAINGAFMLGRRAVFAEVADPPPYAVFDEKFFMYGDDLDLCIRVARGGRRVVYDGRVQIVHLKGMSVAKDYDAMSRAIFDANRDVYLKHFNPRRRLWIEWKYRAAFGVWKGVARLKARLRGHRRVRPL